MLGQSKVISPEISFDSLRVDDKLIINTQNYQYQFKVIDPTHKMGLLSGGRLGAKEYEAFLLCTSGDQEELLNEKSIKPNTNAHFLLQLNSGITRFYTSPIKNLQLLRMADSWQNWLQTKVHKLTARYFRHS